MTVATFHLNLTFPRNPRFAETVRGVAVQAARQAGCAKDDAETFGRSVEGTVRRCLENVQMGATLPVVVRRSTGPVEVLVDGHTLRVEA